MRTEVITIGDEILIGQIVDTNSAWMGQQLVEVGAEVVKITSISDKIEEIVHAIDRALESKTELILITGGLGPTKDDVTKKALCVYFNCDLVLHQDILDLLTVRYASAHKTLNEANRTQAWLPSACEPLSNPFGTAPGMSFQIGKTRLVSMPGVPYEMKGIMQSHILPWIEQNSRDFIRHRTSLTANVPESVLAGKLKEFENNLPPNVKLAYLPHMNLVRLRLSSRGSESKVLEQKLLQLQKEMNAILPESVISDEDLNLAQILGNHLLRQKKTMSIAESCTGGYVSHLITKNPGSSAYYPGAVVSYSYDIKSAELDVDPELLWNEGAVSEPVVRQMAMAVRKKMNTNFALALSGIAGPDGATIDKPVGTVWLAVCDEKNCYSKLYHLKGNRAQNIERSSLLGLEMLRKLVTGNVSPLVG
jgi:nicotinamide-nucleotide amidase